MARTYRRDSNGRFSSGGGSSRGVKATTAARKAAMKTAAAKPAAPKRKQGPRPGQIARATQRAKDNMKRGEIQGMYGLRRGGLSGRTVMRAQSALKSYKAAASKPAKTSKTTNKARDAYKAARSKAREAVMLAGGRTSTRGVKNEGLRTTVKAAQAAAAKVRAMEKNRGRKRASKKKG